MDYVVEAGEVRMLMFVLGVIGLALALILTLGMVGFIMVDESTTLYTAMKRKLLKSG